MRALMARYGVANQTIASVLERLRREGLIEGRTGAGVFVRERPAVESVVRYEVSASTRNRGYVVERVNSRLATPADRQDGWPGAPVLVVTRTVYDGDGRQLTTDELLLAADRHVLVYELPLHLHTESAPAEPRRSSGQSRAARGQNRGRAREKS